MEIRALDLNAGVWEELAPEAGPGGRKFPASIYDEANGRFVVLGGDTGTEKAGSVWVLNLADDSWEKLGQSGQGPTPRDGALAVYDLPDLEQLLGDKLRVEDARDAVGEALR